MGLSLLQEETFLDILKLHEINSYRNHIELLQLNITKKCNQCCNHCHVNAGTSRKEEMTLETINRILELLKRNHQVRTVDLTGGAPELNNNFKYLVLKLKELGLNVIDRCNLSVLLEKGQEDTAAFLAENKVTIIASLPCYTEENVDYQRGNDIYRKSIQVLKQLNDLGYGKDNRDLVLNLVYNPLGDYLPGNQKDLEADYKEILKQEHGISFHHLYTITNMPINRYATILRQENKYNDYCDMLYRSFNENAAKNVMCKKQVSISWDGKLYDCDFNQAVNIPISTNKNTIWNINDLSDVSKHISYSSHCFGCTAGYGSSCQGKLD